LLFVLFAETSFFQQQQQQQHTAVSNQPKGQRNPRKHCGAMLWDFFSGRRILIS
jgi:hypothetical protein